MTQMDQITNKVNENFNCMSNNLQFNETLLFGETFEQNSQFTDSNQAGTL